MGRKSNEAKVPSCLQGTIQVNGSGIPVWVLFTWTEIGPLLHLTLSLTSEPYQDDT